MAVNQSRHIRVGSGIYHFVRGVPADLPDNGPTMMEAVDT